MKDPTLRVIFRLTRGFYILGEEPAQTGQGPGNRRDTNRDPDDARTRAPNLTSLPLPPFANSNHDEARLRGKLEECDHGHGRVRRSRARRLDLSKSNHALFSSLRNHTRTHTAHAGVFEPLP